WTPIGVRKSLPSLIQAVYRSLATAGAVEAAPPVQEPAVRVKKSVFPEFIICLEDGKKLIKMLKRHPKTSCNMTVVRAQLCEPSFHLGEEHWPRPEADGRLAHHGRAGPAPNQGRGAGRRGRHG